MNEMTKYLMLVAASVDNYCKYLNEDTKEYAIILGYVYRVYQEKIINVSPQGIALILIFLKDVNENDYAKYIDAFKGKVDEIIHTSKNLEEQFNKMRDIKNSIK